MADKAWQNGCVSVNYRIDDFNRVAVGFCQFPGGDNYERQRWTMNGREIRGYHNECLDVSENRTDNGAPVIFWGCHGRANQQWAWR